MNTGSFEHYRPGFSFRVLGDRVEVEEGEFSRKHTVIPLQDISDVSIQDLTRRLRIQTPAGEYEFRLGHECARAHDAIRRALEGR